MHPMSAQLASAGGSAADALHGGQPALVLQPDVYAQLAKLLGLEPAAAALPVPAAFPVFSAAGALIPGLLTDGLGNFWQVVEDAADEVPDDPLNTRELEVAKGADALLDQLLAGYPDVLGDVAQAPAWVDKFGAPHGSASAGSGSPTAYSPASSAVDAASPASYADIDWDVYRSDEIDFAPASIGSAASGATLAHFDAVKTRPAAMYPQAVHAVHQEVAAYAVDGTAPAMSSIDGLYESVDTAAFFASLGGQARQPAPAPACGPLGHSHAHAHAHRNPLSTISHPSLSGSPDRSDRASPPRDDVSYPCPVPGCPASFRCASRGVVYSAARMQLLYSDSVAADRLGTGDEDGEVVSDRDCEFVRHLFAEHEAELSSKWVACGSRARVALSDAPRSSAGNPTPRPPAPKRRGAAPSAPTAARSATSRRTCSRRAAATTPPSTSTAPPATAPTAAPCGCTTTRAP
ncbi:hypothetical protein DFJ74DRAFT_694861 [Hyaloraphidium curvatum]|nr:hypothetical protein DFJ74DRAFT_694861 [Hyaloraphidium curvatum]